MNLRGVLAAAVFYAVGAAAPQQPAEPPPDFAFRFEFKSCSGNTLDTFTNRYIRDTDLSIPFTLSPKQTAAVYEEIVNIGFFG